MSQSCKSFFRESFRLGHGVKERGRKVEDQPPSRVQKQVTMMSSTQRCKSESGWHINEGCCSTLSTDLDEIRDVDKTWACPWTKERCVMKVDEKHVEVAISC